jgi:Holliday junction resolvase-like predicted endonuclease
VRLIPSTLLTNNSNAEKRVFEMLRQVNFGPRDVALHSLNLGHHVYKRWGEIDFLIVSREGIVAIEVKGGRVACRNGIWEFTNKDGKVTRKKESPASQAASAFSSVRDEYLNPHFRGKLTGLTMGWGVLFEGINRVVKTGISTLPEQPDEITGYRRDCAGHNSLKDFLRRTYSYWKGHVKGEPRQIPESLISEIVQFLRPDFEQFPPLNSQLHEFRQELCTLSDEQALRLDDIQENDRISILGGAGTGKTFLAVASARYDAAAGRTVLIVTRSGFLASFLRSHELPEMITVHSIEELSGHSIGNQKWDTLIVDEGQDLCQMETLDLLENVIAGGLEGGRWRWFGDPNNQVSSRVPFDPDAYQIVRELSFTQRLSVNIRTAPPIVERLRAVTAADLGVPRSIGVGSDVRMHRVNSVDETPATVAGVVAKLVSEPSAVRRSDIAVLVSGHQHIKALVGALKSQGVRAEALSGRALSGKARDCVVVAAFDDFKGLERPVICVAGIGSEVEIDEFRKNAYLSFSRANHTLAVVLTGGEAKLLSELELKQAVASGSSET